jgi:O-methyltransferase
MVSDQESYLGLLKRCLTASIYSESGWQLIEGPMPHQSGVIPWLKRTIVSALAKRGIRLVRTTPMNPTNREQGLDWPLFGFTMVGSKRIENIQNCVETCLRENVPGDFVETGVWRGGSCILAKAIFQLHGVNDRQIWCCDSFEGMPKPGAKDLSIDRTSDFSDRALITVSQETVADNFRKFGLLDDKVCFLKGWFSDTLPSAPIQTISVLRMDGDLYQSTMDALSNLYHKVSLGGFIIVDDYYSWKGCKQAVDEFRQTHRISDKIVDIDPHAVFWRKSAS